jgi:methionyl-tRNA synthetase
MTTKKDKKIFITTAIDYTNDVIHVGHAYEKILADCIARYERLRRGEDKVLFTTGTDEHGTTNQKAADKRGLEPLDHVTEISQKDRQQIDALNVSYDRFIRTTDSDHEEISRNFYKKALDNGDIYKGKYEGYYCFGCEAHKTLSELTEDCECPHHPGKVQKLDEENYFFKWTKYEDFLKELIKTDKLWVRPEGKKKEMLAFLEQGLKDITVSRPKYKVSWGFTTPNDPEQIIYVWFDALINYVTEGYPNGFWDENTEIVHFVGKDIARWHTLLWPAMLKSAGYRIPDKVYVHGFLNLEGQKISKSLGNVIRPTDMVEKYGVDATRYYLLKHGPLVEDSDISLDHFEEVYNADLANGLGNTVARLAKLAENSGLEFQAEDTSEDVWEQDWSVPLAEFRVDLALQKIWERLHELDKHINENEPWAIENETKLKEVLEQEINDLREIAVIVEPFIPDAAKKIQKQFGAEKIKSGKPLFPRI